MQTKKKKAQMKTKTKTKTPVRRAVKVAAKRIARKVEKKAKKTAAVAKKAVAKKPVSRVRAIPYVLKNKFLQVTVAGKPFTLNNTHPTFAKMSAALKAKNWRAVPRLVTLARSMFSASQGDVQVLNGEVFYKKKAVHDSLTKRIIDMVKSKKEFKHMLAFMNNLYKNPEPIAVREFYDWLVDNDLPITDDGCLIAYKSVDGNLKDEHTHRIDNSPGKVVSMSRKDADLNYRTQCSYGFHVCSKQYGLYGSRIMAVKINPKDIIAANAGKMRVLRYEVLRELGSKSEDLFKEEGFSEVEKQLVIEVKKERKELIKMLLASPEVKRLIRRKKLSKDTIQRNSYARLQTMAQRFNVLPSKPVRKR